MLVAKTFISNTVKSKKKFGVRDYKITKPRLNFRSNAIFCIMLLKNAIFDFFVPQFYGKQQQISINSRLTNPYSLGSIGQFTVQSLFSIL